MAHHLKIEWPSEEYRRGYLAGMDQAFNEMKNQTYLRISQITAAQESPARAAEVLQKATGSRITASPIMDNPSGAVAEYMRRETQASSPSAPTTTESGDVEQNSGCVHRWMPISFLDDRSQSFQVSQKTYRDWSLFDWCQGCGALQLYGRILAPDVVTTPSTSQSQDRPNSAGTSETTAPLAPNAFGSGPGSLHYAVREILEHGMRVKDAWDLADEIVATVPSLSKESCERL